VVKGNHKAWVDAVKAAMIAKGIDGGVQLAKATGYAPASIWSAFSGRKISRGLNDKIAEAVGLDPEDLWKVLQRSQLPGPVKLIDIMGPLLEQVSREDGEILIHLAERLVLARRLDQIAELTVL
jgi:hypothetical protein